MMGIAILLIKVWEIMTWYFFKKWKD